jgi:hypothetical protein
MSVTLYGTCRGCGHLHAIRDNGTITFHLLAGTPGYRRRCAGVGVPPFEYTYPETAQAPTNLGLSAADKAAIVEVLCEQALADNLGDIRDAERRLWNLLGIEEPIGVHEDPWSDTKATLIAAGYRLPAHLTE